MPVATGADSVLQEINWFDQICKNQDWLARALCVWEIA